MLVTPTNESMYPMEIQSRLTQTIQTHNAVSVPATTGTSASSWFDCLGFDKLAITFKNDAVTANWIDVEWSNDNSTLHAREALLASASSQYRVASTDTKARYARIVLSNGDASAHTMSAWAYLKA